MDKTFKIPLRLMSQPEGSYTVTSDSLPELIPEGDTAEETLANVNDALKAVLEIYEDLNRDLPPGLSLASPGEPVEFETLLSLS